MAKLNIELKDFHEILKRAGISTDRLLLTIKGGWISVKIDNTIVMEFNKKSTAHFNEHGKMIDQIEYKWKDVNVIKKSLEKSDLNAVFTKSIAGLK